MEHSKSSTTSALDTNTAFKLCGRLFNNQNGQTSIKTICCKYAVYKIDCKPNKLSIRFHSTKFSSCKLDPGLHFFIYTCLVGALLAPPCLLWLPRKRLSFIGTLPKISLTKVFPLSLCYRECFCKNNCCQELHFEFSCQNLNRNVQSPCMW